MPAAHRAWCLPKHPAIGAREPQQPHTHLHRQVVRRLHQQALVCLRPGLVCQAADVAEHLPHLLGCKGGMRYTRGLVPEPDATLELIQAGRNKTSRDHRPDTQETRLRARHPRLRRFLTKVRRVGRQQEDERLQRGLGARAPLVRAVDKLHHGRQRGVEPHLLSLLGHLAGWRDGHAHRFRG